ncbi:MAG: SpoIIE family protein phosphatase [Akkermansiaceae bacterium]|nr:SpoIIE family protein phosphatase [Verrucomicrobiales bacterium]
MQLAETKPTLADKGAPALRPSRIRILLIEDNPADAYLIQLMLADAGAELFDVEWVDLIERGLKRISEGGIDIVLSDLSLPDSQGLKTFSRLYAHAPEVPIIVLSGLSDTAIALNAVHEGAQDFLVKGQVDGPLLARAVQYAIERKRMTEQLHRYADELRTKNAQLEADFNMAREIQQIFLPNHYPTFPLGSLPEDSAIKFSHRYISAAAVGGDFFDFFAINDTSCGVFICDVMGHGMRAALITAIMRGLIEELMVEAPEPGTFLTEINRSLRAILRQTHETFLATAFYAVADVGTGELLFSSAGHPSPLFRDWAAKTVQPLKHYDARHGPGLGLFERADYPTSRIPLHERDVLLLFTDGIYEGNNSQEEEFGQQRLLDFVRARPDQPADELLDEMLRAAQEFSGTKEFEDDVCLASVEIAKVGIKQKVSRRKPLRKADPVS